jgi:glycosyltransferase involved in cell wall biosynthesis
MSGPRQIVFLRYWGSTFKTPLQAKRMASLFVPIIRLGWKCYLAVEREPADPSWGNEFVKSGVDIVCLPRPKGSFDLDSILRTRELCRRLGCSILVCDNIHLPPLIGSWLAGVPVRIWFKRAMNSHYEECRNPTFKERVGISTRLSCWLATRVVAVSSAVRDELVEFGAPDHRVVVLNNPRPELAATQISRHEARGGFGYSDSDIVILSIAHAVPVKGWDLLVEAFSKVAPTQPRARLLLVGSTTGAHEELFFQQLQKTISERGLETRVRFMGHVGDVRPALAASDVFALPSRSEGCCNALLEALESGLPCVATRVGNAADVIESGTNGFLVERNNPEQFAQQLHKIVSDDSLRGAFALRTEMPKTILDRNQYAEYCAELYRSLLEHREARVPHRGMHP